jgi:16S rRNA (cytidine1402-2'-O)-methyltransferase
MDSLMDMKEILGDRKAVLAKELTKTFERFIEGSLSDIYQTLDAQKDLQKGEFVVMITGNQQEEDRSQALHILSILVKELPVKQAATLTSQITGVNKNELYEQALKLK